jgi:hypothetical protein
MSKQLPAVLLFAIALTMCLGISSPGEATESMPCFAVVPEIHYVSPNPARVLTQVVIKGQSFQPAPWCLYDVTFGGVSTPSFTYIDSNTIVATVPRLPSGKYEVVVHIYVGGSSNPYPIEVLGPSTTDA